MTYREHKHGWICNCEEGIIYTSMDRYCKYCMRFRPGLLDITKQKIKRLIKEKEYKEEEIQKMCDLYYQGFTLRQIGKIINKYRSTVSKILKSRGVEVRRKYYGKDKV